ncbi:caspase family protein [Nitratireductor mangrovi]|uniref:Caspase family protein n=1 Tax=Nitratireductor mangrovi TaxID=2599600 RepID=A0A5B8L2J0_9HYPH|nr:caspase family protein [Nitratireductor mangrovi]QDZ01942.1 caspase family protein [Nitratireductor mangrovi]
MRLSRFVFALLGVVLVGLAAAPQTAQAAAKLKSGDDIKAQEAAKKAAEAAETARLMAVVKELQSVPAIGADQASGSARRMALVVGNNAYSELDPLEKAVSDARTIADVLGGLGFDVTMVSDADIDAMDDALFGFYETLQPGDITFFFFAGHGVADNGVNYLLPVDVPKLGELERNRLPRKAFDAAEIAANIMNRGARLALMVLDACRNDPFVREGVRSGKAIGGLTRMVPTDGAFVIYSAGTGQTALDKLQAGDPNPNSVFTRKFMPILQTPGLPIVEVAKRTQVEVRTLAASVAHDQAPAYYDQIVGQYYFKPPQPRLFGMVIGIDEYGGEQQLRGAVNDGERVARALEVLGANEVVRIFNRDARSAFIAYAWRSLVREAEPGDTIVFHYAGSSYWLENQNGKEADGRDEFLMLADVPYDADFVKRIGISDPIIISDDTLTEWMEMAAEKNVNVVLVIDGCYGGGLLDREFANISFIGASAEDQSAAERKIGGRWHGIVSHAFADGLEGSADFNHDGFVSQRELYAKISLDVFGWRQFEQTPQFLPDVRETTGELALFELPADLTARIEEIAARDWPAESQQTR